MTDFKNITKKFSEIKTLFKKNKVFKKILKRKDELTEEYKKKEERLNIKTSLAVDIGSSSIKVVQFSKIKGISVLDTFGEIALGPFVGKKIGEPVKVGPEIMTKALDIILDAAGADSLNVSYCVSPNQSFVYSFLYDKKKDKKSDINEYIIKDIKKRYGIKISEYDIDYNEIKDGKKEKGLIEYEVIGIKKKILEYNKELSKNLKLHIDFNDIEIKSIFHAVNHFYASDYFIIDIGSSSTKVYIIKQDSIYSYKVFNIGSHQIIEDFNLSNKDLKDNEKKGQFVGSTINSLFAEKMAKEVRNKKRSIVMNKLFVQIHDFLKEFEVSHKIFISQVVLTGGGSLFLGLEDFFSEALYRKVTIANPFMKVKNPNFVNKKLKEVGPEYAAAIGLALKALNK